MSEPEAVAQWSLADDGRSELAPLPTADQQLVIQLFDELRTPLLRYLLSIGIPAHDGEEVVQEAFLALFEHLRRGRSRQNLRGWMFRVAHNLGLKRRLVRKREVASVAFDQLAAIRPDTSENPEEQFLSSQRQQRFQAILNALVEQDRWCLSLRAEGLRYREIAEVLDMSLGSVSASLARSLARFSRPDAR
jgi:RNA polymerase sigma-70 factor (ECF subfamily)